MTDKSTTMESDNFFKSIPEDLYEDTDGNVEAPTGWFGFLVVDDAFRDAYGAETGDFVPASVQDGVYLVTVDNNGLVWAEQAPTVDATLENYREKIREYSKWDADENAYEGTED